MKKTPAVLIDDPEANDHYDLRRVLSGWDAGLLAVIEPVHDAGLRPAGAGGTDAAAEAGPAGGAAAPVAAPGGTPAGDGGPTAGTSHTGNVLLGRSDSATTRALKTAPERYALSGKGLPPRQFTAAGGPAVLAGLGISPLLLVCFVSYTTYPLIVALAHDERTRDFLRVGVTGVRMDTMYNLARKLFVDGHISYHEHTRVLEKVLCARLKTMLLAHAERRGAGSR